MDGMAWTGCMVHRYHIYRLLTNCFELCRQSECVSEAKVELSERHHHTRCHNIIQRRPTGNVTISNSIDNYNDKIESFPHSSAALCVVVAGSELNSTFTFT
mmetsp:Transcript_7667/g.17364  ORF Transcript_7667/g.17364 Transcript_7667/m.17364 type:complete len:101 (+) Transcript_7667:50-352(+)